MFLFGLVMDGYVCIIVGVGEVFYWGSMYVRVGCCFSCVVIVGR